MADTTVTHATFTIEKTYKAPVAKVFAAFSNPVTKRRWFGEGEKTTVDEFTMDFRVGGHDVSRFRFGPGTEIRNDTVYLDIIADKRIVFAYTMSFAKPFSASLSTISLEASGTGTKLTYTEQAVFFEGSDGAQMRENGWGSLFASLGKELGESLRMVRGRLLVADVGGDLERAVLLTLPYCQVLEPIENDDVTVGGRLP